MPALDGIRGLAVVAVVLFHGNWEFAQGGFLGVSLFFTLSGFLITSLLISEHRRTGQIDLGAFWGRRFRRLLPAAWLTLAAVLIALSALGELTVSSRADLWASFGNVSNWRFLAQGSAYGDLFRAPSPVRHFWSLAIEAQAYVVVPAAVMFTLRFSPRRPLRALALVLGAGWAASVAATWVWSGTDHVYYGTDTRISELLAGSLLAVLVAHESFRRWLAERLLARVGVASLGAVGLAVSVVSWHRIAVTDAVVRTGGLAVAGGLSAVIVLAAAAGTGPVAALGSLRPLRSLGRISYGVYLFHWPLLVFANQRRTGLDHLPRFVLVVAVTLVLATVSYRYFETPLRQANSRIGPLALAPAAAFFAAAFVSTTLIAPTTSPAQVGFDAEVAAKQLNGLAAHVSARESTATSTPTPSAAEPPTIAVFGDSVSLSIAFPVATWARESGQAVYVGSDAVAGCGIGRGGDQNAFGIARREQLCDSWPQRWATLIDTRTPDIAIVQTAQWELIPRRLPGDATWRVIGDPTYDAYLLDEFLAATDTLHRNGALVIWLTTPYYSQINEDTQPIQMQRSHERERVDRLNAITKTITDQRPDAVRIIDVATWMSDKVDDASLRKDGAHYNMVGGQRLATEFIGPQLLDTWDEWNARQVG